MFEELIELLMTTQKALMGYPEIALYEVQVDPTLREEL